MPVGVWAGHLRWRQRGPVQAIADTGWLLHSDLPPQRVARVSRHMSYPHGMLSQRLVLNKLNRCNPIVGVHVLQTRVRQPAVHLQHHLRGGRAAALLEGPGAAHAQDRV